MQMSAWKADSFHLTPPPGDEERVFPSFKGEVNYKCTFNRRFPSCLSPLFQSESKCKAFHMEISFIHTQILVHLHVNKTNFYMKGFALGLALKQGRKASRKSPIASRIFALTILNKLEFNTSLYKFPLQAPKLYL